MRNKNLPPPAALRLAKPPASPWRNWLFLCLLLAASTVQAQLNITLNSTSPICFGLPNGSISATVTGGLPPYNYAWSNGTFGSAITGLTGGTYAVTVTSSNNLVATQSLTLTQPTQVTVSFQTNICANPVTITAVGGGGIPGYNYVWNTGAQTATIIVTPGTYCVTVTDQNLCGVTDCVTVNYTPPSVSVTATGTTCPNSNNGTLTATPSGGQPPYNFSWSNGATGQVLSGVGGGAYTVTLTDGAGCTATATGFVNSPPPIQITAQVINPTCLGSTNGSIFITASGGTGTLSYLWSTGQMGTSISNLAPGTYSVTVIDANGCTATLSRTLTPLSSLSTIAFPTPETCEGANNGFLTAVATGGQQPLSYQWSNGATTQVVTNVSPGNYSLTVTDGAGCTATASTTVAPAAPFVINVTRTNITTCGAVNGTATANIAQGVGPFTFLWSNGANTQTITGLAAGTYSVTVTNGENCLKFGAAIITAPPNVFVSVTTSGPVCPGFATGIATATVGGGTPPFTYSWSNGANTQSITGLTAGTYAVTVTDANGCTANSAAQLLQNPAIAGTIMGSGTVCTPGVLGSASIMVAGGTPPYQYLWSNGATTQSITGLSSGTYSVTTTDSNGCITVNSTTINIATLAVNITRQNIRCFGQNSGTATANPTGGNGPYTYQWSNGGNSQTISNLAVGTYSVTLTDGNGCVATQSTTITQPPLLQVSISSSNLQVCPGALTGSATANPTGGTPPYTYLWSTGATTQTIANLGAGLYTVVVSDANNCTATASITIANAPQLNLVIEADAVVCGAANAGTATANASGGQPPYTYQWSNGATQESVSNLTQGTYTVTATDANGCVAVAEAQIQIISDFSISVIPRNLLCRNDNSGAILVFPSGGSTPYTYLWSTGATSSELINLPAGSYTVTVTEANGCVIVETINLAQPTQLTATATGISPACVGEATGVALAAPSGGTPPYTYLWSNGATTQNVSNIGIGTYTVAVTDANLCTAIATVTITAPSPINLTVSSPTIACGGSSTGIISTIVAGGLPPYTYLWSNGATTASVGGLPAGIYGLTVTDANGCVAIAGSIALQELPALSIVLSPTNIICTSANVGAVQSTVTGGTAPFTYLWSNGANTPSISNLTAGSYSLTVTDAANCQQTATISITQTPNLMLTLNSTNITCIGNNNGTATAIPAGGTLPYTYQWSNGVSGAAITGLAPGTYGVTVSDVAGCAASASVTIIEPGALALQITGTNVTCNGGTNGAAVVQASGGTSPYTYAWSNGANTATATALGAGSYMVTVSDANGCAASANISITAPTPIVVTLVGATNTCQGTASGSAMSTVQGGTPPYTYNWSNGQTTPNLSGAAPGLYILTVRDANQCIGTAAVEIASFPPVSCFIEVLNQVGTGNEGRLQANIIGGVQPFGFLWSDGQTTAIATGLSAGTYSVTVTDINGCTTTCSATLEPRSGLGNYVWEDINKNGLQDPDEAGVPDVVVSLKNASGTVIGTTTTDPNGFYQFVNLMPGTYSVVFALPEGFRFTLLRAGNDSAIDSDADADMNGMTVNVTLAPNEYNNTIDAGIYLRPYSIIGDPCLCLNNATEDGNGQFSELLTIFSYPGETFVIAEHVGMFLFSSPPPPAVPIPVPFGTVIEEVSPGRYEYLFKLVDQVTYVVVSSNGLDTLIVSNTCTYPRINMAELPSGELCNTDDIFELNSSPSLPGNVTYFVNGILVNNIDPSQLVPGNYQFLATLVPFDPNECMASVTSEFTIREDCNAHIGDFVWLDINQNGLQDPNEPGISGVTVIVTGVDEMDPPYSDTTVTNANGHYSFSVPPGSYKLTFVQPPGLLPTLQNVGDNDAIDSDIDSLTLMTHVVTLAANEEDFTLDAGFYPKCDNVTNGGAIGPQSQYICGPGAATMPINNVAHATGGSGELEYLWMFSHVPGPFNNQTWTPIPGSNTASYTPWPVFQTTYFVRCVRRECCTTYLESNIVEVIVGNEAVATIGGPIIVCRHAPANFFAAGAQPGDVVSWDFGVASSPQVANGAQASTTYSSIGAFKVRMWLTRNGCTSYAERNVTVTDSPVHCGGLMPIDVTVISEADNQLLVAWTMPMQEPLEYVVEYSPDGEAFEPRATVTMPAGMTNGVGRYQYMDTAAKKGYNYYRVRIVEPGGAHAYSEIDHAILFGDSKLALLYPNPVTSELNVEILNNFDEEVRVQLVSASGVVLVTRAVDSTVNMVRLDLSPYPAGSYFVRLQYGKTSVKTLKVLKH